MKRLGRLFDQVCSEENIRLADIAAQKNKSKQYGVILHNQRREENLAELRAMLLRKSYKTSTYKTFKIYEPKERIVYRLPFFPDRICQHAIVRVIEPVFLKMFTADTYACIRGRGIHKAAKAVKRALRDKENTVYCLKMDIKKYYPSIDRDILKELLRRKFKDKDLLWVLDEIIDSSECGLPIGNYLSQTLANFYLAGFDHWIKETKGAKYYFRYCDDLVLLSDSKEKLHQLRLEITQYLFEKLRLSVKGNYQVFPVEARGIDFVGYVIRHDYVLLRKSIKKRFARMMARNPNDKSIASYYGWVKHCNGNHLLKTLLPHEQFQQLRYKTRKQRTRRRKDQNFQGTESGNNSSFLQDSSLPF